MLKVIKKYHQRFCLEEAKGLKQKIISVFMLTLPHILTILIFILLFPEKMVGILIVGLILPDFFYFFDGFICPRSFISKSPFLHIRREAKKRIANILTFVVVVVLLFYGEYILVLVGGMHLFLDLLGF